ncbi:MAG: hypothetical protein FWF96_01245 [Kiritimatiellaeota bacterium]|nr:hypothetical protein [Kiritimatiellota bacterium]
MATIIIYQRSTGLPACANQKNNTTLPACATFASAFSTLELLFVALLISLLIGLLTPAVRALNRDAQKRRAQTDLQTLAQALHNYQLAYGVFPFFDDIPQTSTHGVELDVSPLMPGHERNPRDILFVELPRKRPATDNPNHYLDPWGMPYRVHYVIPDDDTPVSGFILLSGGPMKNVQTTITFDPGGALSISRDENDILLQSY